MRDNLIKFNDYINDPSSSDYQILHPLKSFFKKATLVDRHDQI